MNRPSGQPSLYTVQHLHSSYKVHKLAGQSSGHLALHKCAHKLFCKVHYIQSAFHIKCFCSANSWKIVLNPRRHTKLSIIWTLWVSRAFFLSSIFTSLSFAWQCIIGDQDTYSKLLLVQPVGCCCIKWLPSDLL